MSDHAPVVTLLTDYGTSDEFVGVCHGVIATICPHARIIDLTHGIPRQDVRAGAMVLAQALTYLPIGVHVAIVDPTVGTDRRAVALMLAAGRVLVGPDNGLLWPAAQAGGGVTAAVEISASEWRLQPTSSTFHGRDIFVPVAARLAAGGPFEAAGEQLDPAALVRLQTPEARIEDGALIAAVTHVDHFGNVQLAALGEQLWLAVGEHARVLLPSRETLTARVVRTFSDVGDGELLLFEDASQRLALALNRGSAAGRFGLAAGDELWIAAMAPDG